MPILVLSISYIQRVQNIRNTDTVVSNTNMRELCTLALACVATGPDSQVPGLIGANSLKWVAMLGGHDFSEESCRAASIMIEVLVGRRLSQEILRHFAAREALVLVLALGKRKRLVAKRQFPITKVRRMVV